VRLATTRLKEEHPMDWVILLEQARQQVGV
jgi:hypothetical protein